MALETGTYINSLVATNPVATDGLAQADDHMRLIKATIKATFPSITGAVTSSHTELNALDGFTGTVADLNYAKDLNATGVTATEFDYLDGVTSNIQTQISGISTDLVADTSPQLGGSLDTNGQTIAFGSWTIAIDGSNNLTFSYGGDVKVRMTALGALDVEDDITAFSGI